MEHEFKRRRRTIRLKEYDYSSTGAYFVTICAYGQQSLFEDPTLKGIIERTWRGQRQRFLGISLDALAVMPNHVHLIVWLDTVGAPLAGARGPDPARAGASPAPTLGTVVGAFKSIVATEWLRWLEHHAPHRSGRVWQRNYYERIVRDDEELGRIRQYIHLNPLRWEFDRENPHRVTNHDYQREWGWLEAEEVTAPRVGLCPISGREFP